MRLLYFVFLLIASVPFLSCSNDSVANGTGSNAGETELASIAITDNNGLKLTGAIIRIWEIEKDSLSLTFEDTTNKDGTIEIESKKLDKSIIEVRQGSFAGTLYSASAQKALEIKVSETVRTSGRILENEEPAANAIVRIFDKSVTTDNDGSFTIDDVPQGVIYAYVSSGQTPKAILLNTANETNTIELTEKPSILVEDFENWNSRRTLLGKMFGQGWWFISTDSLKGGNSKALIDFKDDSIIAEPDESFRGGSFHEVFDIDENFKYPYASAGFALGDDYYEDEIPSFYDMRKMTGISFYSKGKGTFFLQLTCKNSNGEQVYYNSNEVDLSKEWSKVTMDISDFDFSDKFFTLEHVNTINFVATEDIDIYLDNIQIEGISITEWPMLGHNF